MGNDEAAVLAACRHRKAGRNMICVSPENHIEGETSTGLERLKANRHHGDSSAADDSAMNRSSSYHITYQLMNTY